MLRKRAQVTLFFILALLIFFVFSILYMLHLSLQTQQLKKEAITTVQNSLLSQNVLTYINSCLDKVTYDALEKLGKQGMLFYNDSNTWVEVNETFFQNYLYGVDYLDINDTTIFNETFNSTYIVRPFTENSCSDSNFRIFPPEYPLNNTPLSELETVYNNNCLNNSLLNISGFFGLNYFGYPCSYDYSNSFIQVCFPGSENYVWNLEQQIEMYVSKHITECLDFNLIQEITPYNISIEKDSIFSNLTFSSNERGFDITVNMPIQINVTNSITTETVVSFRRHYNLRLLELATLTYLLILRDTRDIFFDKNQLPSYFGSLFLRGFNYFTLLTPSICLGNSPLCKNDSVFVIYDENSLVRGKPLSFFISIKNRRPALDLIDETQVYEDVDIFTVPNETIVIDPLGIDPDDFSVFYNYSGWREDYFEIFNSSLPNCPSNPSSLEDLSKCMQKIFDPNNRPRNWTLSQDFIQTQRKASYTPNFSEIGYHVVNVSVKDIFGLEDWQKVDIVVLDNPVPEVNGTNFYEDINDSYASLEDPYLFYLANDFQCQISSCNTLEFFYNDTTEDVFNSQNVPDFYVPYNFTSDSVGIENISDYYFYRTGLHEIEYWLTYTRSLLEPNLVFTSPKLKVNVTVKECLPHRNLSPAYPYNTTSGFYANHTCCLGDPSDPSTWQLANQNDLCFAKTAYVSNTSLIIFNNSYSIKVGDINFNTDINFNFNPNDGDHSNDIWKVEFKRYCDGTRGNVCAGNVELDVSIYESCADTYFGPYSTGERCQGPPLTLKNSYSFSPLSCVNYDGTTFEKEFGSGTGVCSTEPICQGYFKGNRTCDGQGGCTKLLDSSTNIDCRDFEEEANINYFTNPQQNLGGDPEYYYGVCTSLKRALPCSGQTDCQFDTSIIQELGYYSYDSNSGTLYFYLPKKIDLNGGGENESCIVIKTELPVNLNGQETCFPHNPSLTSSDIWMQIETSGNWQERTVVQTFDSNGEVICYVT